MDGCTFISSWSSSSSSGALNTGHGTPPNGDFVLLCYDNDGYIVLLMRNKLIGPQDSVAIFPYKALLKIIAAGDSAHV